MRCREWIAVAGDLFDDTLEWEDGAGHFGRCLKVKSDKLKEKASKLSGKVVLIRAYYPKGYERSEALGVLVDIREAIKEDFKKAWNCLHPDFVSSDFV